MKLSFSDRIQETIVILFDEGEEESCLSMNLASKHAERVTSEHFLLLSKS